MGQVRVAYTAGEAVGPGLPQRELLVRSPRLFKGYHRDREAKNATKDTEGWVHTGDADLATDSTLARSQIHRDLSLHKELEADGGELTRTRKVRRGFIGQSWCPGLPSAALQRGPQ